MIIALSIIYSVLAGYVGVSSLEDDNKTGFYVVATLIYIAALVITFFTTGQPAD